MNKLLSLPIGVPTITVLFIGGLTIMIIPINDALSIWLNPITFTLWGLCLVWFVAMLWYRQQGISIQIYKCELTPLSEEVMSMKLEGFIHSRHPEGLKGLKLWLNPIAPLDPSLSMSEIPYSINSEPQRFSVCFEIAYSFLDHSMEEQAVDGVNALWILSTDMINNDWLYLGDIIPVGLMKGGQLTSLSKEVKYMKVVKKKKEGSRINHKQFNELIEKASQPIKKSNSEKY